MRKIPVYDEGHNLVYTSDAEPAASRADSRSANASRSTTLKALRPSDIARNGSGLRKNPSSAPAYDAGNPTRRGTSHARRPEPSEITAVTVYIRPFKGWNACVTTNRCRSDRRDGVV